MVILCPKSFSSRIAKEAEGQSLVKWTAREGRPLMSSDVTGHKVYAPRVSVEPGSMTVLLLP